MAGKKSILVIVVLIVLGLVAAGGVSYYIATKVLADKSDAKSAREPGVMMKVGDPKDGLIVNIGGVNSGRYLKIGLTLEMKPGKKAKESEGKINSPEEIKVQDTILYILRSQKIEDFDSSKQDRLKELIKTEVNKTLGDEVVYEVYITNFVLQ